MKKVFTVLALITVLGLAAPAFAAPPPIHHGHGAHQTPYHHRPAMHHPVHFHGGHGGLVIQNGYYGDNYYYRHRMGNPHCRCPHCMAHRSTSRYGIEFYVGL